MARIRTLWDNNRRTPLHGMTSLSKYSYVHEVGVAPTDRNYPVSAWRRRRYRGREGKDPIEIRIGERPSRAGAVIIGI